jgi:hypothetical protein
MIAERMGKAIRTPARDAMFSHATARLLYPRPRNFETCQVRPGRKGFSVHSKVRAQTRKEAERVGKYMIRPLLSLVEEACPRIPCRGWAEMIRKV